MSLDTMSLVDTRLIDQFRQVEEKISNDQGEFTLFGLFERDDIAGKFDVVVSAFWLHRNRASLLLLADLVRTAIDNDNWWPYIGKFVILTESDPFVKAVVDKMPNHYAAHELKVLNDLTYEGEPIRNAIIITAQRRPVKNITAQPVAA